MTRDQVKSRAAAMVMDFKEEGLTMEEALNLSTMVACGMICIIAGSKSNALELVDTIAVIMRDAVNNQKDFAGYDDVDLQIVPFKADS